MYQDAHMHLQDFRDHPFREEFIRLAGSAGMERVFCNTSSPTDWNVVATLARSHKAVIPFFGVHPWYAMRLPEGWQERLKKMLQLPRAGMGEIGLDKTREEVPWRLQKDVFEEQLALAVACKKPFVLHCVRAWGELIAVLKMFDLEIPFMVHAFYGPVEMVPLILELGGYISFTSRQLEHAAPKTKKALAAVPCERLLLETDSPGWHDTIRHVQEYTVLLRRLYKNASMLKGVSQEFLEEKVWENGSIFAR